MQGAVPQNVLNTTLYIPQGGMLPVGDGKDTDKEPEVEVEYGVVELGAYIVALALGLFTQLNALQVWLPVIVTWSV